MKSLHSSALILIATLGLSPQEPSRSFLTPNKAP